MRKVLIIFIFLFVFIINAKADLTKNQENSIAIFTTNFIVEGNKRVDKNGNPLIIYMQGQARIDGFQSKLYKVKCDYKNAINLNENKWAFDDASFVSFIYYHLFNLSLTYNKTSIIDAYSGIIVRNPMANPYQVSAFLEDADRSEHFYYVKKDEKFDNLNNLKSGDLIITNNHIMVYLGDEKIAEATSDYDSNISLGIEINSLKEKYGNESLTVIRIKNNIISPSTLLNTIVKWPDNEEKVNLVPNNEENLMISYELPEQKWVNSLELEFNISSINGLKDYFFSFDNEWVNLLGSEFILKKTINENGSYYLKVRDLKGNEVKKDIIVSSIDNIKPTIESIDVIYKDNYSIIEVKAIDNESGLDSKPYSFDGGLTWVSNNTYVIDTEEKYIIKVKDNASNIESKEIEPKINNKAKPSINSIIYGDIKDEMRKVTIVVLNCHNCQIKINDSFESLKENKYITYLKPGTYNVEIKDNSGNIARKSFKVDLNEKNSFGIKFLIGLIPIFLIICSILLIRKRKVNRV